MHDDTPEHGQPLHAPEWTPCIHIKPGTPRLTHAALLDALLADYWMPTSILSLSEATGAPVDRTALQVSVAICERCHRRFGHALYYLALSPTDALIHHLCHYCGHVTRIG